MSVIAKAWNDFRYEILREAAVVHLIPVFEREHKQRLLTDAKEVAATK